MGSDAWPWMPCGRVRPSQRRRSAVSLACSLAPLLQLVVVRSAYHGRSSAELGSTDSRQDNYPELDVGDVVANNFVVEKFLGEGRSSRVYLVCPLPTTETGQTPSSCPFAMKVFRSGSDLVESMQYERDLVQYIQRSSVEGRRCIATVVDVPDTALEHTTVTVDEATGQETTTVFPCIAFEHLGLSVDVLMDAYRCQGIPLNHARQIVRSTLTALCALAELNIVHADVKPENLLFTDVTTLPGAPCDAEGANERNDGDTCSVKLTDFGLSYVLPRDDDDDDNPCGDKGAFEKCALARRQLIEVGGYQRGVVVQTREYRSPEVILGRDFGCSADVWSLGCLTYELLCGTMLFDPKSREEAVDEGTMDALHLQQIMDLIGYPPESMLRPDEGEHVCRYFAVVKDPGAPEQMRTAFRFDDFGSGTRHTVDLEAEMVRALGVHVGQVATDFIRECLKWIPQARGTPKSLLSHPFLLSNAL